MIRKISRGFTLIELLVVIAIIGILAGFIFMGASRFMRAAKEARVMNTMNQFRSILTRYCVDDKHSSYPPRYGYLRYNPGALPPGVDPTDDAQMYWLKPYTVRLEKHRVWDYYDEFSEGYDTNQDGQMWFMEYTPIGAKVGPNDYTFGPPRFSGYQMLDAMAVEYSEELRPFVYIPVNKAQFNKLERYYYNVLQTGTAAEKVEAANARIWGSGMDPSFPSFNFPPPSYDAFVLMSVGPDMQTGGVLPYLLGSQDPDAPHIYHITALRAYYLATRDLNENGQFDFDFASRAKGGGEDAKPGTYEAKGYPGECCLLPGQNLPGAGEPLIGAKTGPMIYVHR